MKTIYTSLPIYNKYQKQCFERGKHAGYNTPVPIVCPRHRLPSFQWLDDSDGATSVTKIETINLSNTAVDITTWFVTLPALAHDYFTYSGDTLNYLLPTGNYYLKITMDNDFVYYSEWFQVDCVYNDLTNYWYNATYETFTSVGNVLSSVIETGSAGYSKSDPEGFSLANGESINIIFYLTKNSGELPTISIRDLAGNVIDSQVTTEGLNNIELTSTGNITVMVYFANTAAANWSVTEIHTIRQYSTKYVIIDFHNGCDMGDFYYHGGFTQTIWFISEPMETVFPLEESGITNGEGQVIRTFARQTKKYVVRTDKMSDYMVDLFNRMRLHDTITLTDLLGDTNTVYNLEVEHEWLAPDKYYAQINLTFDTTDAPNWDYEYIYDLDCFIPL